MEFDLFLHYGPDLLKGFAITLLCWIVGSFGGALLGFVIACLMRWAVAPVRWVPGAYVEVIRGTPFMIQLFLLYRPEPVEVVRRVQGAGPYRP